MKKKIVIISVISIIALVYILSYKYITASSYNFSLIAIKPNELYVEAIDGADVKSYIYDNKDWIEDFEARIRNKNGMIIDINDFHEIISFDYGFKGIRLRIDEQGRVLVPVRIIDLKEESALHYLVWKTYQYIHNEYWAYYVSEPDLSLIEMIEDINFVELE